MVKGKVVFEDEEKIEIKYPCFELKDIIEYYFKILLSVYSISEVILLWIKSTTCKDEVFRHYVF